MGPSGDITDEFDDDSLRRSIESADKSGEWRNDGARFEDPKLKALAKQLAEAPRASYTERRLAELDRRAAERAKRTKSPATQNQPEFAAPEASWRETVVTETPPPAPPLAPVPAFAPAVAASSGLRWLRTVASAMLVFGVALGVHVAIVGWQTNLGVRAVIAAVATGIAWHVLGAGRFRSAAIATAAHLVAFLSSGAANTDKEVFAAFLGAGLVLMLGGAVGLSQEAK